MSSVIVYGGREGPWQSASIPNAVDWTNQLDVIETAALLETGEGP
jgi:hypothetical protein